MQSLQLLLCPQYWRGNAPGGKPGRLHRQRQEFGARIVEEVLTGIKAKFKSCDRFCHRRRQKLPGTSEWCIVASRVLQEFYRPTIILGGDGEKWRGIGRSIAGFDLAGALPWMRGFADCGTAATPWPPDSRCAPITWRPSGCA